MSYTKTLLLGKAYLTPAQIKVTAAAASQADKRSCCIEIVGRRESESKTGHYDQSNDRNQCGRDAREYRREIARIFSQKAVNALERAKKRERVRFFLFLNHHIYMNIIKIISIKLHFSITSPFAFQGCRNIERNYQLKAQFEKSKSLVSQHRMWRSREGMSQTRLRGTFHHCLQLLKYCCQYCFDAAGDDDNTN